MVFIFRLVLMLLLCSVPRMLKFLSCYDPNEALMIGEAYGFHAHKDGGYSYLTGGGG